MMIGENEYIPEKEVLKRWPLLSTAELRTARYNKKIAWLRGKQSTIWYRPNAVVEYLSAKETKASASEMAPEAQRRGEHRVAPTLSPELEAHVAHYFAEKIMSGGKDTEKSRSLTNGSPRRRRFRSE